MDRLKLAREFAGSVKAKYPEIGRVVLYGSVAAGTDREDSDIDILIASQGNRSRLKEKLMKDVVETMLRTGAYISVKIVSGAEYTRLGNTHFISEIEEKGVLIG